MDKQIREKTETILEKLAGFKMRPRFLVNEEDIMKLMSLARRYSYYQVLTSPDDMWCSIVFGTDERAIELGFGEVVTLHKDF